MLSNPAGTTFLDENQQGGYAGNYHFHAASDHVIIAKDELTALLKKENEQKDTLVKQLMDRLDQFEEMIRTLKG